MPPNHELESSADESKLMGPIDLVPDYGCGPSMSLQSPKRGTFGCGTRPMSDHANEIDSGLYPFRV